jgi:FMN-dependent NADH-azoreductase
MRRPLFGISQKRGLHILKRSITDHLLRHQNIIPIPSSLKAWIDQVVRAGVTFRYTAHGPEGLMKHTKAFLAVATGGIYTDPTMKELDFTERYLTQILSFIGINDVTTFRVEGVAVPGLQDTALAKALANVAAY